MKKWETIVAVILVVITLIALVALVACAVVEAKTSKSETVYLTNGTYYALTTVVVEVDRDNDTVTCEDYNGHLWEFYGCEDWEIGDLCNLVMFDCGTAEVTDDVIVRATYERMD